LSSFLSLIILIFATSGMREDALAKLRIQDITALPKGNNVLDYLGNNNEIDNVEGGKIVIYRGDKDQDYAFITPECYKALIAYLEARRELGETITLTSPLILKRIPRNKKKGWVVSKCISTSTIGNILVNVAVRAGIRKLSDDTHT
jgi:integrase